MWVWSTKKRLDDPNGTSSLLESVRMAKLDEVYLSINDGVLDDPRLAKLVAALVSQGVRVEGLCGDATWYRPEKRDAVFAVVDAVARFDGAHPEAKIAALHFDIEPHQLPENRGDHPWLPALADTLRAARDRAATHGLGTSADLPRFAFDEKGALFAEAVDRPFVMLYQLREKTPAWLARASGMTLDHAYAGVPAGARGRMVVGLRVEDYPDLDPMLASMDEAHGNRARYGGWAIHDEARWRASRR